MTRFLTLAAKARFELMPCFKATLGALTALTFILMSALPNAAGAEGYSIRPGDVLQIEVLEDPTLNRTALVDPTGRISVPQGGTIKASGQSVDAIAAIIAARLAPNFATAPSVFVSLQNIAQSTSGPAAAPATISVFVIGEANKAGRLDLEPGTTVMQIFAEMGGFTKFAATKRIQLRRTDAKSNAESVVTLSYPAIEAGTSTKGNTQLQDGDVLIIPQRKLFE
jgi:polysaccharide export outer membrane protein